ncbi:MAG: peptidylprolyl isomerase [Nitrospinae bacterium]|nr:peptidylprolyl isomerase [Nitrospinota bacterium]
MFALVFAVSAGVSHAEEKKSAASPATTPLKEEVAVIKTSLGTMTIRFFPNKAPNHVENFKKLARSGFYNGTTFHRVIPGFMIQGGDPTSKFGNRNGVGGGGPGWTVNAEFNDVSHKRGIVSMARTNDPNSAGSQFFICVADATALDGQYSAFGEVVEGIEVADKIAAVPRDRRDMPDSSIEMKVSLKAK